MSLTVAYSTAYSGLSLAEKKLSILSANVTNADQAGYTRKSYQTGYITSNGVTTPIGGTVVSQVNQKLLKNLTTQYSDYQYQSTLSSYLTSYSNSYGSTAGTATTLSSAITGLDTAMQKLSETPNDSTTKAEALSAAQILASLLQSTANTIGRTQREIEDAIATSVASINTQLTAIDSLNRAIGMAGSRGDSTASLEDQRNAALQTLSAEIGIQYSIDSDNHATVYTSSGTLLVGSRATTLTATGSTITAGGTDISGSARNGTLGALLELSHNVLPDELEKIDTLALTLADTINSLMADGTSVPAPATLQGTTPIDNAAPLNATGTWRVAVLNSNGMVVSTTDLDLSSYSTAEDLKNALDAISGISASFDADGKLVVSAENGGEGVAFNSLDSDIDGLGASHFFGFNALFVGDSASTIKVNPTLTNDSSVWPTATLSGASSLTAGERGVSSGDSSTVDAVVDLFAGKVGFPASGNFSSRTVSLSDYASAIIAGAAQKASSVSTALSVASASYEYTSSLFTNSTGVNIDEEMAMMTELQNYYEANAMVIATVRELFTTMLDSYR